MPAVRAVLFDLGGTLYDYRTLEAANRESLLAVAHRVGLDLTQQELLHAQRAAVRRTFETYLPQPFYLHRDLFRDTLRELLARFGYELTQDDFLFYRALQRKLHARDFELRPGARETLVALRERGLHLGIVSNIDEDQLAQLVELGGLAPSFDSILSSERAGSCKPDGGIYREALRRAGCAPHEALFVGDSRPQDVAGANRSGIPSVLLWQRDDRPPPEGEPRPRHVIRQFPEVLALL